MAKKGARKSGSRKVKDAGNPPPMPARRRSTPDAMKDRLQRAAPVVKGMIPRLRADGEWV